MGNLFKKIGKAIKNLFKRQPPQIHEHHHHTPPQPPDFNLSIGDFELNATGTMGTATVAFLGLVIVVAIIYLLKLYRREVKGILAGVAQNIMLGVEHRARAMLGMNQSGGGGGAAVAAREHQD